MDETKKMRWTTWISGFIIYCVLQWISFKIWILLNQEYNGDVKQGLSRLLPSTQGKMFIFFESCSMGVFSFSLNQDFNQLFFSLPNESAGWQNLENQ